MKTKKSLTVEILNQIGIGENESTLYVSMLGEGKHTVEQLTRRKIFPRTMLYYVLRQLVAHDLVSEFKEKGKTTFIARHPDVLYDIIASQEKKSAERILAAKKLIPELKLAHQLAPSRTSVRVLEGLDGLEQALEEIILAKPTRICAFETLGKNRPGIAIRNAFNSRRIAKKIKKDTLIRSTAEAIKELDAIPYNDYTRYRSVDKNMNHTITCDVLLYDGNVLLINYSGHHPTATCIGSADFFAMQQNMFNNLWMQGKDHTLNFVKPL